MFFGTADLFSPAWERWYFSLVDIVAALTDSTNPRDYPKKLRRRDPNSAAYRRPGRFGVAGLHMTNACGICHMQPGLFRLYLPDMQRNPAHQREADPFAPTHI